MVQDSGSTECEGVSRESGFGVLVGQVRRLLNAAAVKSQASVRRVRAAQQLSPRRGRQLGE